MKLMNKKRTTPSMTWTQIIMAFICIFFTISSWILDGNWEVYNAATLVILAMGKK